MAPDVIRCLVVEDEEDAVRLLRRYIETTPGLTLTAVCNTAAAADQQLLSEDVDLLLLDINLPGITGVDWLRTASKKLPVIFTTADPGYAVAGFELDAIDYLLKPFSYERFLQALERYRRYCNTGDLTAKQGSALPERAFITVRAERLLQKIYFDELRYIEAKRNHLVFHCNKAPVRVYQSLSVIETQLPQPNFLRIHRSFIVPLQQVVAFSATTVWVGADKLPIGRLYQKNAQELLAGSKAVRRSG